MTNAIEARELTRTHGSVRALDGATLEIRRNSITGLLGRNGAGKTTFMALATGQDRPSSGKVLVNGETPFERAHLLERMCFIRDNQRYPDDYRLKNVLRAGALCFPHWDADFARELVDLFQIPEGPPVKKFSRGQFSGLGIVMGLASRAPITFFDEPYLGLDAPSRSNFYDVLLRDYSEHPRTIVVSTHLIDEMDRLFERVVLLERGRVIRDADVEELRGSAYQVTGREDDVTRFLTGRSALTTHRLGGLASAVIEGRPGDAERSDAAATMVDLGPVSLQDLVAAYGVGPTSAESEGAAA